MRPFDPRTENRSELIPHQAVNSKVGGGVENEQEVHQTERRERGEVSSETCRQLTLLTLWSRETKWVGWNVHSWNNLFKTSSQELSWELMISSSVFILVPCSTAALDNWLLVTGDWWLHITNFIQITTSWNRTTLLLDDAFTQEELGRVHEDPGDVAHDEDHHDADENQGKVHLVVDAGVGPVRSSMCVSLNKAIWDIFQWFFYY